MEQENKTKEYNYLNSLVNELSWHNGQDKWMAITVAKAYAKSCIDKAKEEISKHAKIKVESYRRDGLFTSTMEDGYEHEYSVDSDSILSLKIKMP